MSEKLTLSVLILLIFSGCSIFSSREIFYLSPDGDDANPGTRQKPFASVEKAKEAIRIALKKGRKENLYVWLDNGEYRIGNPVVFNGEDSGTEKVTVVYKALKGAKPVFSGGIGISGLENAGGNTWKAAVPVILSNGFRELFINGKRATRARHPNEGFLRVKEAGADRRTNFFFEEGDFPIPEYPRDVELILLHDWSVSRIAVKEINNEKKQLVAVDSIGAKEPGFFTIDNWEKNPRYYLENAGEFLDAINEWFFDRREGMVYVNLPESVRPDSLKITVPLSEGLVLLEGSEDHPIRNVHFEGITFCFSSWMIPQDGYCGIQACHFDPRPGKGAWDVVPAAVNAFWAQNCTFRNCKFQNLGGTGLRLGTGCNDCRVENSEFFDISGNGIMIGEGRDREVNGDVWWKTVPEQAAYRNSIENCVVSECGKQFFGAVGIWCGLTARTTIKNNEVRYLPYTGISMGWEWSPQPTPCRENHIIKNHIHHVMQILSDGGGIYMLGLQPGSILSGNQIHDVEVNAGRAESNGMFLDEGITDVVVENNLIYNIARSPLRFHRATTNLVRANYLFCREGIPPIRYNRTIEEDIQKVDNKIYTEGESNYGEELKRAVQQWKVN